LGGDGSILPSYYNWGQSHDYHSYVSMHSNKVILKFMSVKLQ